MMQPFRVQRQGLVKQYLGGRHGDGGSRRQTPLNLMRMAMTIYRRQLAARAPLAIVTPYDPVLAPVGDDFERALNLATKEMRIEIAIEAAVTEALFMVGIVKVGLSPGGKGVADSTGVLHDPGLAFADSVDFDDLVMDMEASREDRQQFMGDRYEITLDALKKMGIKGVKAHRVRRMNEGGDEKVLGNQTSGGMHDERGYIDMAQVWDVFLPLEQKIVMVESGEDGGIETGRILRTVDWTGPELGPYHKLAFETPPGSMIPSAPAANLADLDAMTNAVMRKLLRQAERQKTVGTFVGGSEGDGGRVINANDGEMIQVDSKVDEVSFGGVHGPSLAFLMQLKEMFSYMGGNLDSLGGLGRQANTVGQETLIARASNMMVADMQDRATNFAQGIVRHIGTLVWDNPVPIRITKESGGIRIPWEFKPEGREGTIDDFEITIGPNSMQSRTPQERLATMSDMMTRFFIPMSSQMPGKKVDMERFAGIAARYANTPELSQVIVDLTDEEKKAQQSQSSDRPLQSPVTTRTNIRESISGTGPGGQADAMRDILATAGGSNA